jgi:hypothetical protein
MARSKSQEAAAKELIVSYVYRWWKYGNGTLLDKDCNAKNIGLARGTEDACAELQKIRELAREAKRKGDRP